ncbi:centromere protein N-A-like [Anneissia japonica]|uniref:centromere protein N-A-like n=1 Tax=Anneissia japonica TaxID=1529436 RepID=UPI0014258D12|nr:centromere protein N-A-like [Anneissia japonica]
MCDFVFVIIMITHQEARVCLQKVLNRFKKEELPKSIKDWGFLDCSKFNFDTSKKSTVDDILRACLKKKIKPKKVFELQLISAISNPTKKWTVYQLTKSPEASPDQDVANPDEIHQRLKRQLSLFFKHFLSFRKHGNALWFHVAIQDSQHPRACFMPSNSVLIVHYPHSHYVMVTSIKAAYKDFVMQALMNSLECTEIRELQLSGQSLDSLADMVLNRSSQGDFSQYRHNKVDENPLVPRKSRKRTIADTSEELLDGRISRENIKQKKRCDRINTSTFGSYAQPVLQTLKYTLDTNFRGSEFAPAMAAHNEPFHCKVRFEGSNVLEGIKQLGPAGLASLPLPHHLGGVHSLAKNHFVLAEKKIAQQTH